VGTWPPYWVVARLCATLGESFETFDGSLALTGVDPLALPLPRLLNAFEVWMRQNLGEADAWRFDAEVYQVPSGAERHPLAKQAGARSFESRQAAHKAERTPH
jgi:hypothetical protein